VALAKGCCRGEVGAAQVHADNRLQSIDILAGTGRRVPGIAEAILGISPREAWRAGGDGNLIMNRRGRQPLGLGHDDRVDGSAFETDLAAQTMTLLLVEIDVVVRIVEEALVLLDEIAAETDRKTFGKRNIDRALRLEAVILEAVARTRPA